jgi:surfactin family lipopeptide synthetase C
MSRIVDSYPLSPLQEGMLFNVLYAPNSGVDISQFVCRMHHSLDVPAFRTAWRRVVSRHAVLRTGFNWERIEEPRQMVYDEAELEFEVVDFNGLSAGEQNERLETHLREDRRRGFDVTKPPLIRIAVFPVSDNENIFVWSLHHLPLDALSCVIVIKDVFALYEASLEGREVKLDEPVPYRKYIDWLQKQDIAAAENFWRTTLKGFTTPVSLSVAHDRQRLAKTAGTFGEREITLLPRIKPALKATATENGFTLYTCFAGAWAILLSRYSGATDVVFASVRGGRGVPIEGAASIVGMLINTLPIRARADEAKPLLAFLKELREQHVAARAFEHSPLARIQRWSEVSPGAPLFESFINYRNVPWDWTLNSFGGYFLKQEWTVRQQANIPLGLDIYEEPELRIVVYYDTSLFDGAAIDAMLGHYGTILGGFAANPRGVIGALPMLTDAERTMILVEWNKSEADYPRGRTIHSLFEEHAGLSPGSTAVALDDRSLTYGQMNERANKLAHHLRKWGVGVGTPVAVCMDRTIEMAVALLGTLKAGGAYVPLDPLYPRERLAFMLEDSNAPVLLTEEKIVGNLPEHRAHTIRLDADWEAIAGERSDNPESGAGADDRAYIIYTSGSTGRPKGVLCRHRSVLNLVADFARRSPVSPGDRCGMWTSMSFDASVMEIFSALTAGGALYIASDAIRFDSNTYFNWLSENRISAAFVPPVMIGDLYDWIVKNPHKLALKRLAVGVEPINERLLAGIIERVPGLAIMNGYGPTETTVCATQFDVRPGTALDRNTPIGRPVQNSRVYILDPCMRPVPIGVRGEIYIGGEGLAIGYLNRPELTAERFVPDPFSDAPGERLYKTGDTARYLADGTIEFIGRVDYQVKVRGFRVEPGEIEAVLEQHASVRDAVVIAKNDRTGAKRLIAYIVPNEKKSSLVSDLRSFLKGKLPDYMVPSAFVVMESLPLTTNGKLDRDALPEPEVSRADLQSTFVAPRDEIEIHLSQIWERVMGVKPIGVTDSFFELGGHSLLAVRLFSDINRAFETDIPLAAIFQSPTIGEIASIIRGEGLAQAGESLIAIQPKGTKPPLFLVHAYGGGVFFYRELSDHLGSDQPFYGLQAVGLDGTRPPHTRVEDMAAHYINEIKKIQPKGPYYIGGRCLGAYVALEMANQLHARGDTIGLLSILDSYWMPQKLVEEQQNRILGHLKNISERGFKGKFEYLKEHAGYRLIKTKFLLTKVMSSLMFKVGRPLPAFMRGYYINVYIPEVNVRAEKKYLPAIYPGIITFFRASAEIERDPRQFWGKLTSQGLEIRMVPATHVDILVDPNVRTLAEKLGEALEEARAKV